MKKILIIFGTRPEAVKMAPVIKAFQNYSNECIVQTCITAQHREMLDQVLTLFQINPDFDLDIMTPGQDLFQITNRAMQGIERLLKQESPDLVLAQGDTTTVLVSALASFYLKIPFGHIEAGLRTYDKENPFPEEINRQLASRIADYHFAPTKLAKQNLIQEGIPSKKIFVTGNTVIDSLFYTLNKIKNNIYPDIQVGWGDNSEIREPSLRTILVTAHRRENFGQGMINICKSLQRIVENNPNVKIIYPVHLNPNVQNPVQKYLAGYDRIQLLKPQEYLPFVQLMDQSDLILTDSGGVQEEAPSLGKPVLVLRDTTERPEAVQANTVKLVGTDPDKVVAETQQLLDNPKIYKRMSQAHNPYGDGHSASRIVDICLNKI